MKGTKNIIKKVRELVSRGVEIVVMDALTNEDLNSIAKSLPLLGDLIMVGSAGLAEYLPDALKLVDGKKLEMEV